MFSFPQSFTTILRAEQHHQSHTAPRRRWSAWFNRLLTGVVFVSAIFFSLRSVARLMLGQNNSSVYLYGPDWEGYLLVFSIAWMIVLHFSLIFQTLSLSANTISRERQGGTWELLTMTGVDANQIVLGKWWAVMRRMFGRYFALSTLRTMVVVWVTIATYTAFAGYGYPYGLSSGIELPRIAGILFSIGFIFLINFLNLGFVAACGLSASPGHSRSSIALARAAGTWLLVVFLSVFIPIITAFILQHSATNGSILFSDTLRVTFGFTLVTMVDNGLVSSAEMLSTYITTDYLYYSEANTIMHSVGLSMVISPAVYALLTWFMLRYATRNAVRQGALPSPAEAPLVSGISNR